MNVVTQAILAAAAAFSISYAVTAVVTPAKSQDFSPRNERWHLQTVLTFNNSAKDGPYTYTHEGAPLVFYSSAECYRFRQSELLIRDLSTFLKERIDYFEEEGKGVAITDIDVFCKLDSDPA